MRLIRATEQINAKPSSMLDFAISCVHETVNNCFEDLSCISLLAGSL